MSLVPTIVAMAHAAWGRLAAKAVVSERRRITRQLDCLLGNALSTIMLRSSLTYRLLDAPARAKEEVGAVLQIARRLVAEVRTVANSYRASSLDADLAAERSTRATARLGGTSAAPPPLPGRGSRPRAVRVPVLRAAVAQERLRVAQDLHDLLGNCLSAIVLKTELTHRLLPSSPDRAREALADVLTSTREALANVHEAATGSCTLSLAAEGRSAVSTLRSVDIDARAVISCGALPSHMETVLAIVLREAVTNVLRHSRARRCLVEVAGRAEGTRLLVANDGIGVEADGPAGAAGTGLRNLRSRMQGIGGQLSAGRDDAGWFRLVAEAPTPRGRWFRRGHRPRTSATGRRGSPADHPPVHSGPQAA